MVSCKNQQVMKSKCPKGRNYHNYFLFHCFYYHFKIRFKKKRKTSSSSTIHFLNKKKTVKRKNLQTGRVFFCLSFSHLKNKPQQVDIFIFHSNQKILFSTWKRNSQTTIKIKSLSRQIRRIIPSFLKKKQQLDIRKILRKRIRK